MLGFRRKLGWLFGTKAQGRATGVGAYDVFSLAADGGGSCLVAKAGSNLPSLSERQEMKFLCGNLETSSK